MQHYLLLFTVKAGCPVSIAYKHIGRAYMRLLVLGAFGAFVASAASTPAQNTIQDGGRSTGTPPAQICEKPKQVEHRHLTLGRHVSSDPQMSVADEQSVSEQSLETTSKGLRLQAVDHSQATPQKDILCNKDTTQPTSEHPKDGVTGGAQLDVQSPASNGPLITYTDGKLTIDPHNAPLGEVIEAIRARAGFSVEFPPEQMDERVFDRVGPVSLHEALVQLLYGSGFNYIIQTSANDPQVVKKLSLSAQTHSQSKGLPLQTNAASLDQQNEQQGLYGGSGFTNDSTAEAIQDVPPVSPPSPRKSDAIAVPGVPAGFDLQQAAAQANKTPAQILDEMQKRQLELLDAQAPQQQ